MQALQVVVLVAFCVPIVFRRGGVVDASVSAAEDCAISVRVVMSRYGAFGAATQMRIAARC